MEAGRGFQPRPYLEGDRSTLYTVLNLPLNQSFVSLMVNGAHLPLSLGCGFDSRQMHFKF